MSGTILQEQLIVAGRQLPVAVVGRSLFAGRYDFQQMGE